MWYKIKQGRHRAYPLSLGIHTGKTKESYEVMFDESCLYEPLDSEDDINKLVGWSYGLHHKNSIRIGWRPSRTNNRMIDLFYYSYLNGERLIYEDYYSVPINEKFVLELYAEQYEGSWFRIYNDNWFIQSKNYNSFKVTWGYNLGLFFGGNLSNPNSEMKVWIKKLKKY